MSSRDRWPSAGQVTPADAAATRPPARADADTTGVDSIGASGDRSPDGGADAAEPPARRRRRGRRRGRRGGAATRQTSTRQTSHEQASQRPDPARQASTRQGPAPAGSTRPHADRSDAATPAADGTESRARDGADSGGTGQDGAGPSAAAPGQPGTPRKRRRRRGRRGRSGRSGAGAGGAQAGHRADPPEPDQGAAPPAPTPSRGRQRDRHRRRAETPPRQIRGRRRTRSGRIEEVSSGGLVVDATGAEARGVLIGKHDRRGKLVWSLPKGHVELGETLEETAVREIEEETGVTAEVEHRLGEVDYWFMLHGEKIHKTVHHFLLRFVSGELCDRDREVVEVAWVPLDELPTRLAHPDERRLIAQVGDLLSRHPTR